MSKTSSGIGLIALAATIMAVGAVPRVQHAQAQIAGLTGGESAADTKQPVTFRADRIEYNQKSNIVTLSGHVEAWQAGHVLFADRLLYDRNTNISDAIGHVVLISPDGQVVYSDYAELSRDMTNGIMKSMNVTLPSNAKLAANGARRTEGKLNELSHAVYTACEVCLKHPESYPLWQIRARSGVQDLQHHVIEYKDATMQIYGVPVAYFPYFWHPDPTAKRMSGLLIPSIGVNSHLGGFLELPYYIVLDDQSDATVTPILTTHNGAAGDLKYRRAFNFGQIDADASGGYDQGKLEGALFAHGTFDLNDTWRAGFDFERASSVSYLNDYSILPSVNELTSDAYLEGFGNGSYARIDSRWYQGLTNSVTDSELPVVLPHAEYSFTGTPDTLGGHVNVDASFFNILRSTGTNTLRGAATGEYELPFHDNLGGQWSTVFHLDAAGYSARDLSQFPNFSTGANDAQTARALPQIALNYRWPLINDSGRLGSELIEPIFQLIAAPIVGNNVDKTNIPNEDSFDFNFTDANLFGFNKYPGLDRLESGMRANLALHGAWYLNNGSVIDGLVGQSYRAHKDDTFPVGSGLEDNISDIVAKLSYTPNQYVDFTYRTRLSHVSLQNEFIDAFATAGVPVLRVSAGYLYSSTDPYFFYDGSPPPASYFTPRNEATLGVSTQFLQWTLNASAQRNLQTGQFDATNLDATWQNDCLALSASFSRRYTSVADDDGSTTLLFRVVFKTLGGIGFNAL
jgi:LPS-assembly protein